MTFEADLFTTLKGLVGNRVYPMEFPQPKDPTKEPRWPAIRYTFVDAVPEQDICGDGDDQTGTPRVQLDVVSRKALGYDVFRLLRLQVLAAMRNFPTPARLESSGEEPDDQTDTYRARLDYSIHGSTLPTP